MAELMTDLVPHVSGHRRVELPSSDEAERLYRLAYKAAGTEMVPKDMQGKPDSVMATAIAGREIGLSFFESLRSFHVIEGKPSESAELLHTLALRAGHDVYVAEATDRQVTVMARHREWPEDRPYLPVVWSIETAANAELFGWDCVDSFPRHTMKEVTKNGRNGTYTRTECGCKDNWRKYTRSMLRSRALSEAVRSVCPDVTVGSTYTPEEMGAAVSGPGGVPDGSVPGFGATGEDFTLPQPGKIDGIWIGTHSVDQVIATVDYFGPDYRDDAYGDATLVGWVIDCEEANDRRPRLLEALRTRAADLTPADDGIQDAEVIDDDPVRCCEFCGDQLAEGGDHNCEPDVDQDAPPSPEPTDPPATQAPVDAPDRSDAPATDVTPEASGPQNASEALPPEKVAQALALIDESIDDVSSSSIDEVMARIDAKSWSASIVLAIEMVGKKRTTLMTRLGQHLTMDQKMKARQVADVWIETKRGAASAAALVRDTSAGTSEWTRLRTSLQERLQTAIDAIEEIHGTGNAEVSKAIAARASLGPWGTARMDLAADLIDRLEEKARG